MDWRTRVFEVSVVRQAVKMALCLLPPFKRLFFERDAAQVARDAAVAERDAAVAERDAAQVARDAAVAARNAAGGRVQPLGLSKILVETDATIEQFEKMLGYMNRTWKKLGESEPYFSVVTNEKYKMANIRENEQKLFSSGMHTVSEVKTIAGHHDIDISKYKDCFELGCGVGRMTIWLAKVFDKVFAADISAGHLGVAAQAIAREGLSNVKLIKFDNFDSVDSLPEFDVFVSFIVLQHNPPPMAAALIEKILRKIRVGGLACFQCQTYLHDYKFVVADYIRFIDGIGSGDSWEMHCIPQSVFYDIFARNGFSLLEVREDVSTGTGISNTFLARRDCVHNLRA